MYYLNNLLNEVFILLDLGLLLESFDKSLEYLDNFINIFLNLFQKSFIYHFFLIGFENYDFLFYSYLSQNLDIQNYPIMLELYAEQLRFNFDFLKIFYDPTYLDHNIHETMRSQFFFFYHWFSKATIVDEWYSYNLFLNSYYECIFNLPLNYNIFYPANYGLDFELNIYNYDKNFSYYLKDNEYVKYYSSESGLKKSNLLYEIYNNINIDNVVLKNVKNFTTDLDLTFLRNRFNVVGKAYKTNEDKGPTSDYVVSVWEYINKCCEDSVEFAPIRWWQVKAAWFDRPWWVYGSIEWWPTLVTVKYLLDFYRFYHFVEDYLEEVAAALPFDFENSEIKESVFAYFPLSHRYVLWGQPNRNFWVEYLFNIYSSYTWTILITSNLKTMITEPHFEYIKMYNFIISKIDNTQVNILSEYYNDFLKDKPVTKTDFYGIILEMKEQRLLNKLQIKSDYLVFFIEIYEKSEKFYEFYLDCRWWIYFFWDWCTNFRRMFDWYINCYFYDIWVEHFRTVIIYRAYYFLGYPLHIRQRVVHEWQLQLLPAALYWLKTLGPHMNYYFNMVRPVLPILIFVYFFITFLKSALPHFNIVPLRIKNKKNVKNKTINILFNKNKYSNININNTDYLSLVSKINNLESWIFNIDSNDFYSNSKFLRFFRLDKKSRKDYLNILKSNSEVMYNNLFSSEIIDHGYKNNTKIKDNVYLNQGRFIIMGLTMFKTILIWVTDGFYKYYISREWNYSTQKEIDKPTIIKWNKHFTTVYFIRVLWPLFLIIHIIIYKIWRMIWRSNAPIYSYFNKRISFNEKNLNKTHTEIQYILTDIEKTLDTIKKNLNSFYIKDFDPYHNSTLTAQRWGQNMPLYSTAKATKGGRMYYILNLIFRFWFIWWYSLKRINLYEHKTGLSILFFQKLKKYLYFIFLEYWIFRNKSNTLKKFKYSIYFMFDFSVIIFFPFFIIIFPFLIIYLLVKCCLKIYSYIGKHFNYSFSLLKSKLEVKNRFIRTLFIYILVFWRFIYKNPKNSQGLIVNFYVKILHKNLIKIYRFYRMSKGAYILGLSEKTSWKMVLNYWYLLFKNWFDSKIDNLNNWFNHKKNYLNYFYIVKSNKYKFRGKTFFDYCYESVKILFLTGVSKILLVSIYIIQFVVYGLVLTFYNIDIRLYIMLFTNVENKVENWCRVFYFRNISKVKYLAKHSNGHYKAFKLYWKKDWKSALKFLYLQILAITPYGTFIGNTYKKYFVYNSPILNGEGYTTYLKFFSYNFKFLNYWRKEIHFYIYYYGIRRIFDINNLKNIFEDLEIKRLEINVLDRMTWFTETEVLTYIFLKNYIPFVHKVFVDLEVYIDTIEHMYRQLDKTPETRNWSLEKRLRFVYLQMKAIRFSIKKIKTIEKKRDSWGYQELKIAKKAKRIFFFKALINFFSMLLFGKTLFKKNTSFRFKFKSFKMNDYLDYNINNHSSLFWFLAIIYRYFYQKIFIFYYSGEYLLSIINRAAKSFQRFAWPGYIPIDNLAQVISEWVFNGGRFVVRVMYSPVVNWPARMVATIFSFFAKRSRLSSRLKTDSNKLRRWVDVPLKKATGYIEKREMTRAEFIADKKKRLKGIIHILAEMYNLDALLPPDWKLQRSNVDTVYETAKSNFEKALKQAIDDDKYFEFLCVLKEKYTAVSGKSAFRSSFFKKYKINILDLFSYNFGSFVAQSYPEDHPHKKSLWLAGRRIKAKMSTNKVYVLNLFKEAEKTYKEETLKNLEKRRKQVTDLVEYEEYLELVRTTRPPKYSDYEKILENTRKDLEQRAWIERKRRHIVRWISDSYLDYDIPSGNEDVPFYFPYEERLRYIVKHGFRISNEYYHWNAYVSILRIYGEWFSILEEQSKVNKKVNEVNILKELWSRMREVSDMGLDGGSTINAYYNNAWVYLYNYEIWAEDEDFDFAGEMAKNTLEVYVKNPYVIETSGIYFAETLVPKKRAEDMITHSPLHYNRYFKNYKKYGRINLWISNLSLIMFFYVLFFLPGEYVGNYHLLTFPFGTGIVSSINYYIYFRPFIKIMDTKGVLAYKLDWRRHNPLKYDDKDEIEEFLKDYKKTFTQNKYFFWKHPYYGNLYWIFWCSWYFSEWYETEAWRHRWFPWDYEVSPNFSEAFRNDIPRWSLQDQIHHDGLGRICGGRNFFSLPYANAYRARARINRIDMISEYDLDTYFFDWLAGIEKGLKLNSFIEKCTAYVQYFMNGDIIRYNNFKVDWIKRSLPKDESLKFIYYKLNEYVATESLIEKKIEENKSIYQRLTIWLENIEKKLKDWEKDLEKKDYILFNTKRKEMDLRDSVDYYDEWYFHFSVFIERKIIFFLKYFDIFFEFIQNLF